MSLLQIACSVVAVLARTVSFPSLWYCDIFRPQAWAHKIPPSLDSETSYISSPSTLLRRPDTYRQDGSFVCRENSSPSNRGRIYFLYILTWTSIELICTRHCNLPTRICRKEKSSVLNRAKSHNILRLIRETKENICISILPCDWITKPLQGFPFVFQYANNDQSRADDGG